MALVTVIVPCFNYGRYLEQCVGSLVGQSHAEWECIIVDDGSTDDTAKISARLAAEDPRVSLVRQENRGPNAARNVGIQRARGDLVQFLDADDILEPDKLKVQVRHLAAHDDIDIVLGDAAFFEDAASLRLGLRRWGGGIGGAPRRIEGNSEAVLEAFVSENICVIHAALLRRRVFARAGLLDETLRGHEDWEFWLRCALIGCRFSFVAAGNDRALVREHPTNTSGQSELMLRTAITVRERFDRHLPPAMKALNCGRLLDLKSRLGIELVRLGRTREGWALYKEALRTAPRRGRMLLRAILLVPGAAALLRLLRNLRPSR
jgi:glycosyltransferase involved in cell wall biosynthesis